MRIGVDAACWANGRGYGRFARELLGAMVAVSPADEFIFFADPLSADQLPQNSPNVRVVRVEQRVAPAVAAASDGSRSLGDMLRFSRAVARERPDVFFFPSVYSYFPLVPGQRAVVTVHDAIAERYPELTLPSARARMFWKAKVWLALRQSRVVLTSSNYSAREIASVIGVRPDRIRIVGAAPAATYQPSRNAMESSAMAARYGVPEGASWFTYVGGFNPHKNVDALVRAHAVVAAKHNGKAPYLLLVGTISEDVFHSDQNHIRETVARAGTSELVRWTGFVSDEDLRHLHSGATALVLASQSEGFGLPAVEAAACGTPVIATTASPLPELLAGGGYFVAPRDEAALARAMTALLDDPGQRETFGACARERAASLSWARGAERTLDALREAAA
ncbi:MAG TPA: glycosyltransferase family 1 protein [Gemmatimonadaceae bacterium]|nr:glycosyltransferase family 1 protein [Gemmatimonadaceae bacterium]